MKMFHGNFDQLVDMGFEICKNFNIDLENALMSIDAFMFNYSRVKRNNFTTVDAFNQLSAKDKWTILYDILIENIVLPLMHIKNTSWHPRDGFDALAESLKRHGAHAFLGKFGSYCHKERPVLFQKEITEKRKVHFFRKNSYIGDFLPYTHCIVVDHVKVVQDKKMVFDPNHRSSERRPEKIFMLSYEKFVERLTNWQGRRYIENKSTSFVTYGRVSQCPDKFGHKIS